MGNRTWRSAVGASVLLLGPALAACGAAPLDEGEFDGAVAALERVEASSSSCGRKMGVGEWECTALLELADDATPDQVTAAARALEALLVEEKLTGAEIRLAGSELSVITGRDNSLDPDADLEEAARLLVTHREDIRLRSLQLTVAKGGLSGLARLADGSRLDTALEMRAALLAGAELADLRVLVGTGASLTRISVAGGSDAPGAPYALAAVGAPMVTAADVTPESVILAVGAGGRAYVEALLRADPAYAEVPVVAALERLDVTLHPGLTVQQRRDALALAEVVRRGPGSPELWAGVSGSSVTAADVRALAAIAALVAKSDADPPTTWRTRDGALPEATLDGPAPPWEVVTALARQGRWAWIRIDERDDGDEWKIGVPSKRPLTPYDAGRLVREAGMGDHEVELSLTWDGEADAAPLLTGPELRHHEGSNRELDPEAFSELQRGWAAGARG